MEGVSAEILARHCGLSSTVVASFARRRVMVRAGRGRFDLEASLRSYCQHLREQAVGRKADDAPMNDRARLAKAQADSVEQRTAIRAGRLLDSDAVAAEWTGACRCLRAGVMRIPRRAAARLGLSPAQTRELEAECRETLTALAAGGQDGQEGAPGG
jgi:terminase small subunit / prophage DNA-packing protein